MKNSLLSQLFLTSAAGAFQQPAAIMIPAQRSFVSHTAPRLLATSPSLSSDYPARAAANNFDPPSTITTALKQPNTYVLDVRGLDEIAQSKLTVADGVKWVTTPCTKAECPELQANPTKFLPDKDATIVVHCASGIRANTAKLTLQRLGYTNVLNGGGLNDILAYPDSE